MSEATVRAEVAAPAIDVAFQAERQGEHVRVGLHALDALGEPVGLAADVDLPTARLWRDHLDRAIGSGVTRTLTRTA